MIHRFTLLVLVMLCVFLIAVTPALAQELTPEALPEATAEATVIVIDDGTVTMPEEVLTAITENERFISVTHIVYGLIIAIGGGIAAGGSFAFIFSRIDRRTKDELERNYEALSPKWQDTIQTSIKAGEKAQEALNAVLTLVKEITDGKPNTDPTQPATTRASPPTRDYGESITGG